MRIELLEAALGTHPRLPDPAELQRRLTDAEIGLFVQSELYDEQLLDAGWYLHAIAGSRPDLDIYDEVRRRQAHQVSAHVFDLHLQHHNNARALGRIERLRYVFAAQVGYIGGDLTPNATALRNREAFERADLLERADLPHDGTIAGEVSLQAGILLLAFDRPSLFRDLEHWQHELRILTGRWFDLLNSPFAAVNGVIHGCWELLQYLVYGRRTGLETARQHFHRAMTSNASASDIDSRWVAAHLLELTGEIGTRSVWEFLDPTLGPAARAMTLGDPPALQLWPPQAEFLSHAGRPLDPSTRRLALSFPTSAGKTMLSQLIVLSHLVQGTGDACIVAPTHSLCREIARGLDRRLSTLGSNVAELAALGLADEWHVAARAVVMTPEKLGGILRNDPRGVLERFGLFVVDEAHLIADKQRGWPLEETISLLHHLTRDRYHRLVVLSAALGRKAHVSAWLDAGSGVVASSNDWRGPRRLHAIYTTRADWDSQVDIPGQGQRLARRTAPLIGRVHLRGPDDTLYSGTFEDPVGTLTLRQTKKKKWVKESSSSTTQRTHLVPLVTHLAASGQVLVVEATRYGARMLAREIAAKSEEYGPSLGLASFVESRVGMGHPLVGVLRRGVGFHHAALPADVQAEIEDAVRAGRLRVLVATSTLTEGVNLPFKAVVIGERGWGMGEQRVELIDSSRLMNAVGRAGRAARETEGWLFISEQQEFEPGLFSPFDSGAEQMTLTSTLTEAEALRSLALFEELLASGEDAIFHDAGSAANGFCSYIWFIATALMELHDSVRTSDVMASLEDTLAFHQLDEDTKERWQAVAAESIASFRETAPDVRRRWARAGTSLLTARVLDQIMAEILGDLGSHVPASPLDQLAVLLNADRLATILEVPESGLRGFKARRSDPRDARIDVDVLALLTDWVNGGDLDDLADVYLSEVDDSDYRSEQLSEFTTSAFEHHVPWFLGLLIGWLNPRLDEIDGVENRISESLPGMVHYGVPEQAAVELMRQGMRSRRFAIEISNTYAVEGGTQPLRNWLASRDLSHWRTVTNASPTELADLLTFVRAPGAQLLGEILDGRTGIIRVSISTTASIEGHTEIAADRSQPAPCPFIVTVDGNPVGHVRNDHHDHVAHLLETGLPTDFVLDGDDPTRLLVTHRDLS